MGERNDSKKWVIELLRSDHNRSDFACGNPTLDRYLKEQAGQDLRRGFAAPFALVEEPGDTTVRGYYTLSSYGIDVGELPPQVAKKLPRYPLVPATLLGRLAVHRSFQGEGIGEFLLMDALHRSLVQSSEIAATAIVVDAIDTGATKFYLHFGFVPFPATSNRLFLPMKAVAALFR